MVKCVGGFSGSLSLEGLGIVIDTVHLQSCRANRKTGSLKLIDWFSVGKRQASMESSLSPSSEAGS